MLAQPCEQLLTVQVIVATVRMCIMKMHVNLINLCMHVSNCNCQTMCIWLHLICSYIYIQLFTMDINFVNWPPFAASHNSLKQWPSDKVKENCETSLKAHTVLCSYH